MKILTLALLFVVLDVQAQTAPRWLGKHAAEAASAPASAASAPAAKCGALPKDATKLERSRCKK
jgi:hypothetical protein